MATASSCRAADVALTLASGSPRRRDLLARLGLPFTVHVSDADETVPPGMAPERAVLLVAERKARAVAAEAALGLILAADTAVALADAVIGKPADAADNLALLRRLRGRTHDVWTGVLLLDPATGRSERGVVRTEVTLRDASDDELRAYVATGEGLDKAGGYGIQGSAGAFVAGLDGCYANVVGLPLCEVAALLGRFGVAPVRPGPVCVLPDGAPCPRLRRA